MDLDLFGTDGAPWQPQYWHAVDDRVRGGASQSYIDTLPSHPHRAHFHGTLGEWPAP